jgi:hypothetical protein
MTNEAKPKRILRYSKTESVVRIVIVVVFAVFLLFFAHILGMWTSDEGWVPLFNVDLFNLNSLGFLILIWSAAAIAAEIIKSIIGRYIMTFAVTSLVSNAVIMCTVGILFFQSDIMNPRFMERLGEAFTGGIPGFIEFILGNANVIVVIVIYLILIVETVKTWRKAMKYS